MYLDPSVDTTALFDFGTSVDYFCLPGRFFEDDESKQKETLVCNEGIWNGTLGNCVRSKDAIPPATRFFCGGRGGGEFFFVASLGVLNYHNSFSQVLQ